MTEDPKNVQFYSERARDLLQSQKNKMENLLGLSKELESMLNEEDAIDKEVCNVAEERNSDIIGNPEPVK